MRRFARLNFITALSREFTCGLAQPETPGQANYVLRKLGFTVVRKGEGPAEKEKPGQKDWSTEEVGLIVADYFTMLEKELLGKLFNKNERRRSLAPELAGCSDGSIEFKHANISAVLTDLGLPYIEGYKPRGNCQSLLAKEVEAFLDMNRTFMEQLAGSHTINPDKAPHPPFSISTRFSKPRPPR
jgi:hypothetical protein